MGTVVWSAAAPVDRRHEALRVLSALLHHYRTVLEGGRS